MSHITNTKDNNEVNLCEIINYHQLKKGIVTIDELTKIPNELLNQVREYIAFHEDKLGQAIKNKDESEELDTLRTLKHLNKLESDLRFNSERGRAYKDLLEYEDKFEQIKTKDKDRSKKGNDIRHEENRSMKADTIKEYLQRRETFKSKDEAAAELAGTYVNQSFATVRKWLKNV